MISELTQEQWDKKTIDLGGSILQSWIWGEFQKKLGFKIHRFSGDNYVNLVIESPMPMGKKYLYSVKGPLGDVKAAQTDLANLSQDKDFVFARVEPAQAIDLPRAAKDTQPTHNWVLGLDKSEQEIFNAMKPKHRYNIHLAEKKGVVIREGKKEDILPFWKILLETSSRNKFRLHPQNYYWEIFESLSNKNFKLLLAEVNGEVIAGHILTFFGDTTTYLHGGSTVKFKQLQASYLLTWEAIRIARYLGYKHYDFGGVAPENEPNHPWSGITRFKKGFGGFEVVSPGAYDMVFSPLWYNVYKNARTLAKIIRRR